MDPAGFAVFVSCRLIALHKCPGSPIDVGETFYRIRCEAAVHSVQTLFDSPDTEAALLVDATNALNSLNRQAALRNIQHLCPSFSTILINNYRTDVALFIDGSTVLSEEGTTQGDPVCHADVRFGCLPLIDCISGEGYDTFINHVRSNRNHLINLQKSPLLKSQRL